MDLVAIVKGAAGQGRQDGDLQQCGADLGTNTFYWKQPAPEDRREDAEGDRRQARRVPSPAASKDSGRNSRTPRWAVRKRLGMARGRGGKLKVVKTPKRREPAHDRRHASPSRSTSGSTRTTSTTRTSGRTIAVAVIDKPPELDFALKKPAEGLIGSGAHVPFFPQIAFIKEEVLYALFRSFCRDRGRHRSHDRGKPFPRARVVSRPGSASNSPAAPRASASGSHRPRTSSRFTPPEFIPVGMGTPVSPIVVRTANCAGIAVDGDKLQAGHHRSSRRPHRAAASPARVTSTTTRSGTTRPTRKLAHRLRTSASGRSTSRRFRYDLEAEEACVAGDLGVVVRRPESPLSRSPPP